MTSNSLICPFSLRNATATVWVQLIKPMQSSSKLQMQIGVARIFDDLCLQLGSCMFLLLQAGRLCTSSKCVAIDLYDHMRNNTGTNYGARLHLHRHSDL